LKGGSRESASHLGGERAPRRKSGGRELGVWRGRLDRARETLGDNTKTIRRKEENEMGRRTEYDGKQSVVTGDGFIRAGVIGSADLAEGYDEGAVGWEGADISGDLEASLRDMFCAGEDLVETQRWVEQGARAPGQGFAGRLVVEVPMGVCGVDRSAMILRWLRIVLGVVDIMRCGKMATCKTKAANETGKGEENNG